MSTATIASQGQITVPKQIRELLNLHPGDRIDFIVEESGRVYVQPVNIDVEELSGILHKPGRATVSVEQMNEAIQRGVRVCELPEQVPKGDKSANAVYPATPPSPR